MQLRHVYGIHKKSYSYYYVTLNIDIINHGIMVSWYHGILVSLYHGIMYHGMLVSKYYGIIVYRYHNIMISWYHIIKVSWYHSSICICLVSYFHSNRSVVASTENIEDT